jgi:hypothetical protein
MLRFTALKPKVGHVDSDLWEKAHSRCTAANRVMVRSWNPSRSHISAFVICVHSPRVSPTVSASNSVASKDFSLVASRARACLSAAPNLSAPFSSCSASSDPSCVPQPACCQQSFM